MSKQLMRSGTSVGALIREAEHAQSTADYINKLSIALKEANETDYWLSLLKDSNYLTEQMHKSMAPDIEELLKLLISTIKTLKTKAKP
jgi:four helix bundle protein